MQLTFEIKARLKAIPVNLPIFNVYFYRHLFSSINSTSNSRTNEIILRQIEKPLKEEVSEKFMLSRNPADQYNVMQAKICKKCT